LLKEFVQPNAKINIGLNVIGRLPTGYHQLDMVMAPIGIQDKLEINISDKSGTLKINTNKDDIPTDHRNILYKVYESFYTESGLERRETAVFLEKIIPHEAGLGGGSADGAFFLKVLNKYHNDHFSPDELAAIGLKTGADIPFFLLNKTARVGGIGEVLTPVVNRLRRKILVVKPPFGVSTSEAYRLSGTLKEKKAADIPAILRGLAENRPDLVDGAVQNQLEQGLLTTNEKLAAFKRELEKTETYRFFMSGSGSAYYAFVPEDTTEGKIAELKYKLINCEVFLCNFL